MPYLIIEGLKSEVAELKRTNRALVDDNSRLQGDLEGAQGALRGARDEIKDLRNEVPASAEEVVTHFNSARYVDVAKVIDPDSNALVELEVWKDEISGGLFAVDASFIEQVDAVVTSPFGPYKLVIDAEASDYSKAIRAVAAATGTGTANWESAEGPYTGVGNEFFFHNEDHGTYYVCVDQGEITSCQKQD